MWRMYLFENRKFQKKTDKLCRSLSLISPSLSGLPLFGGCTGLETSPLYALSIVLLGSESIFLPLLAWFGARMWHPGSEQPVYLTLPAQRSSLLAMLNT